MSDRPAWFVLTRHWLSLVGAAPVTTAVISWLFVLPQQIRGHVNNPYIGIVIFLVIPIVFFTGLVLIPLGVYLSKRCPYSFRRSGFKTTNDPMGAIPQYTNR